MSEETVRATATGAAAVHARSAAETVLRGLQSGLEPAAPAAPVVPAAPVAPAAPAPTAPAPTAPAAPAAPAPVDISKLADRFTAPPGQATPPAAPPAPPADVPPPDPAAFRNADGTPDKGAYAFAQLRHNNSVLTRQVRAADERAAAAETARQTLAQQHSEVVAQLQQATKDKADLQEKVGRLSLEESPEFQARYTAKAGELQAQVAQLLVRFSGSDPQKAETRAKELLALPTDRLAEAVADLHPSVQGAVTLAASNAAALAEQRALELKNWRQTAAAIGVEAARTEVLRTAEDRRRIATEALAAARAAGNPLFTTSDAAGVQQAQELETAFQGFMQIATPEQLARAAAEGFGAPLLYQTIGEQQERIVALEAQVRAYTQARNVPMFPSFPTAPVTPVPAAPQAPAEPMTASEVAQRAAAGALSALEQGRRAAQPS
jgi:hypothetical protein